jgi:hypothetical protein
MYAIRKADLKQFTPDAASVCRIEDGSTNSYLKNDRAIEDFLKEIEPNYNSAVAKLRSGEIDHECIYAIAGFVANLIVCTPGGMRIGVNPIKKVTEEMGRRMDAAGLLPKAPDSIGGESLTEMLNTGEAILNVDPRFPQAFSIAAIRQHAVTFGNFGWEILINPFKNSPFFTSDYPVAIEKPEGIQVINRIVPLAPDLVVKICPDRAIEPAIADPEFSNFKYVRRVLDHHEVEELNRLIVRSAETTVFFKEQYKWVRKFVKDNAAYRIEPVSYQIPFGKGGTILVSTQEIREFPE